MTAKEALIDRVQELTEEEAQGWLVALDRAPQPRPRPVGNALPSPSEMLAMSEAELDDLFRRFPPETDLDELDEWERGTGADIRHIDD